MWPHTTICLMYHCSPFHIMIIFHGRSFLVDFRMWNTFEMKDKKCLLEYFNGNFLCFFQKNTTNIAWSFPFYKKNQIVQIRFIWKIPGNYWFFRYFSFWFYIEIYMRHDKIKHLFSQLNNSDYLSFFKLLFFV